MAAMRHQWVKRLGESVFEVRFPTLTTNEEMAGFCATASAFYDENSEPFFWLINLEDVEHSKSDPAQRKIMTDHLKHYKDHLAEYCAAMALVLRSGFVRGIISAVFWVSPPGYPYKIFAERDGARRWLLDQLAHNRRTRTAVEIVPRA